MTQYLPRQLNRMDSSRLVNYRQYLDFYNGIQWLSNGTGRRRQRRPPDHGGDELEPGDQVILGNHLVGRHMRAPCGVRRIRSRKDVRSSCGSQEYIGRAVAPSMRPSVPAVTQPPRTRDDARRTSRH